MQEPREGQADLWEQVWREYDSRRSAPAVAALPVVRVERRRRPRGRGVRALLASCIMVSVVCYAVAPLLAAARLGEALAAGDTAWLTEAVDWRQVSPALSEAMLAGATGHSDQAQAFLRDMAQDVARGMATPDGMAGLLRERLPRGSHGATSGMGMIGSIRPLDATRWEVALHAPGEAQQALSITLSLRDAWRLRWQVTGMAVAERPRDIGS
ncbi:MAG: DUF2939 domain-containing protein [Rubritepida sp.]|nr:DUF2939 domain-containing protein [Rubritepida sp.]